MDRLAEPVGDHKTLRPRDIKKAMQKVFDLHAFQIVQLIGGDNFDRREQESWVVFRIGNAPPDILTGHTDLVQDL